MDAAGSERAALFGYSEGGPMCVLFAATCPEGASALITHGSYARRIQVNHGLAHRTEPLVHEVLLALWLH
jgi:pimeloyl-ACP methyl ester carboxylesterase